MRRILLVNLLILSVFASVSYWTAEKEKLEAAMESRVETAVEQGTGISGGESDTEEKQIEDHAAAESETADFIKWVDFDVSKFALSEAYEYDRDSYGTDAHISWIDLLAWTAAYTGGVFDNDRTVYSCMQELEEQIAAGEELETLTAELPYYLYYQEVYAAVLGGMVGEYEIEEVGEDGSVSVVKKYGLKAFHPIAKGFPYTDYDDFGVSRSYGYERQHLGHDMMGQTGTPIIAVESGYVEALGWNQYGGWRIGIRSFDGLRYYYYAHLRQGLPYQSDLEEGSVVLAGDVIGYMGHTGYSATEDTNNIDETHLHFGMQIIFDESQKEGSGEIWIDCYQIVGFLYRQQSEVERDDETKVWRRVWQMKDPAAEAYERTKDFSMYP